LPREAYVLALASFNVGVELGQVAVLAAAFVSVGWLRTAPQYRPAVVIPSCTAIAVVAAWWTLQRTLLT
jgi:hypothetical protein